MKKLKDFKGAEGIRVLGELMPPVITILSNPKNSSSLYSGNIVSQIGAFFRNNPKEVMEMLAIMDEANPETYEIDAQSALSKLLSWFDDPELQGLFGLQSETVTSSGSATAITKE